MVIKGGDESPNTQNVFRRAALPIALAIAWERFGYYSATGSITTFFTKKLKMSNVRATQMQSIQQAIAFSFPILGGVLADVFLGRYKIGILSIGTACCGLALMCVSSYPSIASNLSWLFLLGLLAVFSVGASIFKPALIVFGGDQFPESVPELIPKRKLYFDFIYFVTNVGSFTAFAVVASLAVNGMGSINSEYSFWFTFCMAAVLYLGALCTLMFFQKNYWVKDCEGSALVVFAAVTGSALKNRVKATGIYVVGSAVILALCVLLSIIGFFWVNKAYQIICAALILISCILLIAMGKKQDWVLEASKSPSLGTKFTEQEVKNVAETYRILPFVSLSIPFWAIYNQMNTNFVLMGCQSYSPTTFFVPTSMSLFNAIGCMTFSVFVQSVMVPLFLKMKYPLTNMRRIIIGLGLCVLAMAIATGIEVYRKSTPIKYTECTHKMAFPSNNHPFCKPTEVGQQVPLHSVCISWDDDAGKFPDIYQNESSLFLLVPQYILVGFAEILVAATYYDVFYAEVPPSLRTVCQTINYLSVSLGTLVGAVINTLLSTWVTDDLNDGNLEYVYITFVVLALITQGAQMYLAHNFDCKSDNELLLSLGYKTRTQVRNEKKGIYDSPVETAAHVEHGSKSKASSVKSEVGSGVKDHTKAKENDASSSSSPSSEEHEPESTLV